MQLGYYLRDEYLVLNDVNWSYSHYLYLIQKGYSVPLFLGVNHWANGLTPIDLKIAEDKTTLKLKTLPI